MKKTRYWDLIDLFGETHVAKKWLKIAVIAQPPDTW